MTQPGVHDKIPVDISPWRAPLRAEIVETQKTGADFIKWKLIASAAVASLAIGVGQHGDDRDPDLRLLICLIPLICAYADLMSTDLAIRILSIAAFMRTKGDLYEKWVQDRRGEGWKNPFGLAPLAVHGSSVAMNLLIVGMVLFGPSHEWPDFHAGLYVTSAVAGTVVALLLWAWYYIAATRINNYPVD